MTSYFKDSEGILKLYCNQKSPKNGLRVVRIPYCAQINNTCVGFIGTVSFCCIGVPLVAISGPESHSLMNQYSHRWLSTQQGRPRLCPADFTVRWTDSMRCLLTQCLHVYVDIKGGPPTYTACFHPLPTTAWQRRTAPRSGADGCGRVCTGGGYTGHVANHGECVAVCLHVIRC